MGSHVQKVETAGLRDTCWGFGQEVSKRVEQMVNVGCEGLDRLGQKLHGERLPDERLALGRARIGSHSFLHSALSPPCGLEGVRAILVTVSVCIATRTHDVDKASRFHCQSLGWVWIVVLSRTLDNGEGVGRG